MAYAAKTKVPVERSRHELGALVKKHGATDIVVGEWSAEGVTFVGCRLDDHNLLFKVPQPTEADLPDGCTNHPRHLAQLHRARWRLLVLCVKAKLELVAIGQSSVSHEFLGNIVVPGSTTTLGEHLQPQLRQLDGAPPALPAPRS